MRNKKELKALLEPLYKKYKAVGRELSILDKRHEVIGKKIDDLEIEYNDLVNYPECHKKGHNFGACRDVWGCVEAYKCKKCGGFGSPDERYIGH